MTQYVVAFQGSIRIDSDTSEHAEDSVIEMLTRLGIRIETINVLTTD